MVQVSESTEVAQFTETATIALTITVLHRRLITTVITGTRFPADHLFRVGVRIRVEATVSCTARIRPFRMMMMMVHKLVTGVKIIIFLVVSINIHTILVLAKLFFVRGTVSGIVGITHFTAALYVIIHFGDRRVLLLEVRVGAQEGCGGRSKSGRQIKGSVAGKPGGVRLGKGWGRGGNRRAITARGG